VAIDREKVLAAAQKYVEKKKYDKAVIEYERIIQEDPNDARTLLKMGDLQLKMEGYADAVATYERVGKFYALQGFSLKAIAVYKQIREIIARHVPKLEDKYSHIGPKLADLYQQLGLTSDALAALDEVATRLQRQNRDQEAIEVFRKIVDLDSTNPLPHLRLAEALSRTKDVEGAVLEFGVASGQLLKLGRRDDALKVIGTSVPWPLPVPPVKWVGLGCQTPCAAYADEHKLDVKTYCSQQNQPVRYSDGGCKLFNSCESIHCKEVCHKAGAFCAWEKTACVSTLAS